MTKQLSLYKFVANKRRRLGDARDGSESDSSEQSQPDFNTVSIRRKSHDRSLPSSARPSCSSSESLCDIALSAGFPPVQPTGIQFPTTVFSGKGRSFNPAWFKYPWLEYSVSKDAAFCYPCRLFGNSISTYGSRPEQAFTRNGFRDWKHATGSKGILVNHDKCLSHKESLIAWEQFRITCQSGSVADRLSSTRADQ